MIARWTSVDPLAVKYPSLTPYNYVGNNPLRNIDPDGAEIVDAKGNAITYTVKKDGSLQWSPNATDGAKTIGNALAKSGAIGDLNAFRDTKVKVSLLYSSENNPDELGHTTNNYDSKTGEVTSSTVTIYGGSIDEYAQNVADGKTYPGEQGHAQTYALKIGDRDAVVAGAAGHERIHATDKQNQKDRYSNFKNGTKLDTEKAADANETKVVQNAVLRDVLKNVPIPIP